MIEGTEIASDWPTSTSAGNTIGDFEARTPIGSDAPASSLWPHVRGIGDAVGPLPPDAS